MTFISMSNAVIGIGQSPSKLLNANSGLIGESDAIEFPQEVEQFMKKMGVQGELEWGRTGERGGEVKIKTMATSRLGAYLRQKFELQRKRGSARIPFVLLYNETDNGQRWACNNGTLVKGPYGPKAGSNGYEPATWTIEFEDIQYSNTETDLTDPPALGGVLDVFGSGAGGN